MITASPFVLVVFGATGDLMHRKLMPAVYRLLQDSHIGAPPVIIGVGRRDISDSEFREMMAVSVREATGTQFHQALWERIASRISYQRGFFEEPDLYERLVAQLRLAGVPRFYYLATPPQNYETILTALSKTKLNESRILIEKPFGKDLTTARSLEHLLSSVFTEKQIYRIDHYLDKESVQNILALRFANGIFEPTWNEQFIDHVQISLLESTGIAGRGVFYDGVGALRDVVQNHMLQMLAFTAMDRPKAFDSENLRAARRRVLSAISSITPMRVSKTVVCGQYDSYRQEKDVKADTTTETYVALKLFLDTPRWRGVPFYLRTGKKLKEKVTEISLHFKKPVVCTGPLCLFPEPQVKRNVLVIRISPDTGMGLRLMAKKPGLGMNLTPIEMQEAERDGRTPHTEYEKLLLDAIRGDQTLFAHSSEVEASWRFVTKILDGFPRLSAPHSYTSGSWGPIEADEFIEKDERHWFLSRD